MDKQEMIRFVIDFGFELESAQKDQNILEDRLAI